MWNLAGDLDAIRTNNMPRENARKIHREIKRGVRRRSQPINMARVPNIARQACRRCVPNRHYQYNCPNGRVLACWINGHQNDKLLWTEKRRGSTLPANGNGPRIEHTSITINTQDVNRLLQRKDLARSYDITPDECFTQLPELQKQPTPDQL